MFYHFFVDFELVRQLVVQFEVISELFVVPFSLLDLLIQTELTIHVLLCLLIETLELLSYC